MHEVKSTEGRVVSVSGIASSMAQLGVRQMADLAGLVCSIPKSPFSPKDPSTMTLCTHGATARIAN